MLRWQKCHVDYIVGEGRGKTHPEHISSKWVRPGIDLSAVPGTLEHLPYAQHCWALKNLHWAQTRFRFSLFPTSRRQKQYFYHQDNHFSNNW